MKFKFIGNAGGTFIGSNGTRILCDPWIVDGVFEDAWYHYPPLKTTDGSRFTSSKEKSGSEVLQNFSGRIFDCIQLFDICSIFIQAFISRFINVVFLLSEPLLLQPRHTNTL